MKYRGKRLLVLGLIVLLAGFGPQMAFLSSPAYAKSDKKSKTPPPVVVPPSQPLTLIVQPGNAPGLVPDQQEAAVYSTELVDPAVQDMRAESVPVSTVSLTTASTTNTAAAPSSMAVVQSDSAVIAPLGIEDADLDLAAAPGSRALILYDAPSGVPYAKFGKTYAIMLRNLLGHFQLEIDLRPVEAYAAGDVENYAAIFYLGSYFDNPLPQAFLVDVVNTQKTVVWFKYNIWKLAWDPNVNFNDRFGFAFYGLRGLNAPPDVTNPEPGFFDTVLYKAKALKKYYHYDASTQSVYADPDVGITQVLDPVKAQSFIPVKNSVTAEEVPYIVRSGNFWYVADVPFSYIGPRDRYLAFCDILHDMLGIDHAESHKAMVRLEDVSALVTLSTVKTLSNYLFNQKIPFSIAVIPVYKDPFGLYNGGVPQEIHFAQASALLKSLAYAVPRGGSVVMHGLTHQYAEQVNPHSGVSADDFEFWNVITNSPVAEDSLEWAADRIATGVDELTAKGYPPFTFETPHYQGSPNSYQASGVFFKSRYGRAYYYTSENPQLNLPAADPNRDFSAGQFFPYMIYNDYYGQIVLPENLGNIEYDISAIDPSSNFNYGWNEVYTNAQYAWVVRDGYASFFFHPFWLEAGLNVPGLADFKSLVSGITKLGYTWVGAKTELGTAQTNP